MAMNNWRANKIAKASKASRTPGKTKGDRCMTNPIKKFFACSSKATKHPQYEQWNDMFKAMNSYKANT